MLLSIQYIYIKYFELWSLHIKTCLSSHMCACWLKTKTLMCYILSKSHSYYDSRWGTSELLATSRDLWIIDRPQSVLYSQRKGVKEIQPICWRRSTALSLQYLSYLSGRLWIMKGEMVIPYNHLFVFWCAFDRLCLCLVWWNLRQHPNWDETSWVTDLGRSKIDCNTVWETVEPLR